MANAVIQEFAIPPFSICPDLDELKVKIKRLRLGKGDVLVVQLECDPKPGLQALVEQLRNLTASGSALNKSKKGLSIFIVPKGIKLESMSEEDMNKLGWFRRSDYRRLIRREE
jgi:hypothetical protein